jgi:hypothetical protein
VVAAAFGTSLSARPSVALEGRHRERGDALLAADEAHALPGGRLEVGAASERLLEPRADASASRR